MKNSILYFIVMSVLIFFVWFCIHILFEKALFNNYMLIVIFFIVTVNRFEINEIKKL